MKIFISVAGPDRPKIEEVALALRDEGHSVFLDEHELPPGASYHRRIREAIARADLVVFFISPLSLQSDRYTLSELKFIQDKWPHPRGRVLPTLIAPTDFNMVPAYLKAVTICKPRGNLAAEVSNEVMRMSAELSRGRQSRDDGKRRGTGLGDMPMAPLAKGVVAGLGFGALAVLIGMLTYQLAPGFKTMGMRPLAFFVFLGFALTLMIWLAALLSGVREPIAFIVLAAGSVAACVFQSLDWMPMADHLPALYAGKSMIFALFAATVLPGFRNLAGWVGLAAAGLIAGQLATFSGFLENFIWEALLVSTVAFLLALSEEDTARAS